MAQISGTVPHNSYRQQQHPPYNPANYPVQPHQPNVNYPVHPAAATRRISRSGIKPIYIILKISNQIFHIHTPDA